MIDEEGNLIYSIKSVPQDFDNIKKALRIKPLFIMILLGAAAYGGNFLQLLAADKVPASVQFPLVSGGVIILSALVSALLFKDNLSKKEWISVIGAFLSTFLFAF
jgi:multidrug transporter EmrE-like cation transporter